MLDRPGGVYHHFVGATGSVRAPSFWSPLGGVYTSRRATFHTATFSWWTSTRGDDFALCVPWIARPLPSDLQSIRFAETLACCYSCWYLDPKLCSGRLPFSMCSLHEWPFFLGLHSGDYLSEDTAEPSLPLGYSSPIVPGTEEDFFLAGFIVTWLCIFVLPIKEWLVRSSALLAASQISRGERLSLAPAVLARIYRVMGFFSEVGLSEVRDQTLPWQYIHAWIHIHVHGAFSCPTYFLERGYPAVIKLSRASSALERERVRLFFCYAPLVASFSFQSISEDSRTQAGKKKESFGKAVLLWEKGFQGSRGSGGIELSWRAINRLFPYERVAFFMACLAHSIALTAKSCSAIHPPPLRWTCCD